MIEDCLQAADAGTVEVLDRVKRDPHEWLRDIALGEPVKMRSVRSFRNSDGKLDHEVTTHTVYPDLETRIRCAIAAAPYYAPRKRSTTVTISDTDYMLQACQRLSKSLPD